MSLCKLRPRKTRKVRLNLDNLESRNLMTTIPVVPIGPIGPIRIPSVITLTSAIEKSSTEVDVTWTPGVNQAGYEIVVTPVSPSTGATRDITVTGNATGVSTDSPVTGLSPDSTYAFQVEASSGGKTIQSNSATATTAPIAPILTATAVSSGEIELQWTPSPGAVDYYVNGESANDKSTFDPIVPEANNNTTTYTDIIKNLTPGLAYTCEVTAVCSSNVMSYSNSASATPYAAPSLSITPVSATQINLDWAQVAGATSYQVGLIAESSPPVILPTINIPVVAGKIGNYADDIQNLSAGTTYYVGVSAIGTSGVIWNSRQDVLTFPAAPTITASAISQNAIGLTWAAVPGATGYTVTAPGMNGVNYSSPASIDLTGLQAGYTYGMSVAAYNASGSTVSQTTYVTTYEAAPVVSVTAVSQNEIDLAWNALTFSGSFLVEMQAPGGSWRPLASIAANTNGTIAYHVTGLTAGYTYNFLVGAVNGSGTAWAPVQSVATLPLAPGFGLLSTPDQVNVTVDGEVGVTSFTIKEFSNYSHTWSVIGTIANANGGVFQVTGLSPSTSYTFSVTANNASGSTAGGVDTTPTLGANPATAAGHPYSAAKGTLWGNNGQPSYTDVQQGQTGDCWLMASLAEVAARTPQVIEDMFRYDGTTLENGATVELYTVSLFTGGNALHYIEVDTELPDGGTYYDDVDTAMGNQVLWVALAEKAYAEANGLGYVTTSHANTNSYAALSGGWPTWALSAITGGSPGEFWVLPSSLTTAWKDGDYVVLCTQSPSSSLIVGEHCYAMVNDNSSSSEPFQMYNPWGTTASGWAPNYNNSKYGLFTANAGFVSDNFTSLTVQCSSAFSRHPSALAALPAATDVAIGTLDFTVTDILSDRKHGS